MKTPTVKITVKIDDIKKALVKIWPGLYLQISNTDTRGGPAGSNVKEIELEIPISQLSQKILD